MLNTDQVNADWKPVIYKTIAETIKWVIILFILYLIVDLIQ